MSLAAYRETLRSAESGAGLTLDAAPLKDIVWHVPEDMTVKVGAGARLSDLQEKLSEAKQWLPLDPWNCDASIKRIIDENLHGPRRFGHGTVREHLIGMDILLADGRLIEAGGNVVKNVAGYDLMKLFVGARQSLGIVVGATFKLLPLPRREVLLQRECGTASEAAALTGDLLASPVCPIVLDWHGTAHGPVNIVTGFAGEEADVAWQLAEAASMGFIELREMKHDSRFFSSRGGDAPRCSVLPSKLADTIAGFGDEEFVARAGNGTVWCDAIVANPGVGPAQVLQRLKAMFDPRGILPPLP